MIDPLLLAGVHQRDMDGVMESTAHHDRGVYFRAEDYAGFPRRVMTDLVDVIVVVVVWLALCLAILFSLRDAEFQRASMSMRVFWLLLLIISLAYFVILKRSPIRTLGYRLFGIRIVGIDGQRPGFYAMFLRFLFALFGPLNFVLDLMWIPGDRNKQALRDKFAHTYVVRLNAEPAGSGQIVYQSFHILGTAFVFPEVRRDVVQSTH